jgi:hypothetical protein
MYTKGDRTLQAVEDGRVAKGDVSMSEANGGVA